MKFFSLPSILPFDTLVRVHLCLYKYGSPVLVTPLLICAILAYYQGSFLVL